MGVSAKFFDTEATNLLQRISNIEASIESFSDYKYKQQVQSYVARFRTAYHW